MSLKVHIKKDFGSFRLNVNFETNGGVTALLGASGCGKSLTLKCIAGIIKPDEGYIELNGQVLFDSKNRINLSPQKRRVGYMFQSYALFPDMNVYQNIYAGTKILDISKEEKEKKVQDMIHLLQLDGLEKHKIDQISGGQQQRIALARILVNEPQAILLDEPFSALDEYLRVKLELEMKSIIDQYKGDVILVTHNRDEAYLLSDEIVMVEQGHNVVQKETKELFADPEYLSAAILTGCKNNVDVKVLDEHKVLIPQWGIEITSQKEISSNVKYVGIRAHSFSPDIEENRHEVEILKIIEEPFEYLVLFRFKSQSDTSPEIYWRVAKSNGYPKDITHLGFKDEKVLFLK